MSNHKISSITRCHPEEDQLKEKNRILQIYIQCLDYALLGKFEAIRNIIHLLPSDLQGNLQQYLNN